MPSRIGVSVVAGLIAGVVFGMMMQMMTAPTPDGARMPMMAMIGQIVGSPTSAVGWLIYGVVLGGAFVWLIPGAPHHASPRPA
jgi:hypothetical protein